MVAYLPPQGNLWNPLLKSPRNGPCGCGSGRKFKTCCLGKLPPTLPAALVDKISAGAKVQFVEKTADKQTVNKGVSNESFSLD